MKEKRNAYRLLAGMSEEESPLGRPRMWVDDIKKDLRVIEGAGLDWIILTQDRDKRRAVVNAVMNLLVP
jgi:hypothetical protein